MASKSPEIIPQSPSQDGHQHENKLTQCFNDIMRVAVEMMLHQQLKTVQLDSSVVNGFSYNQQRILSEKIHIFHAILDDMETTLGKSKNYVETIYELGREKELQKERERKELKRREEEEERKIKEQEELKKQQELELKAQQEREQQQQQQQEKQKENNDVEPDLKMKFSMDTPSGLLADFPGASDDMDGTSTIPKRSADKPASPEQYSTKVKQEPSLPQGDLGDLGGMDISMFPNMDTGFDIGSMGDDSDPNKFEGPGDPVAGLPESENVNEAAGGLGDTNNNGIVDNSDDYLTLNDFNDLNIDWSATGDPGDLDLNGFNI